MPRFAIFGFPLTHSLSPELHHLFAEMCNISLVYDKIETQPGQLNKALKQFRAHGGCGANITAPLKQEAFTLCDQVTQAAMNVKTVNTFFWQGEQLWGDNTDGEGFIRDLTLNLKCDLNNKRILILGAGGAARGILGSLLSYPVKCITILNRTLSKAERLISLDKRITILNDEKICHEMAAFDLVINSTSASLTNALPALAPQYVKDALVIDLVYRLHEETSFMKWAKKHGAKAVYDGLGMFVEQGALSFARWHQVCPDTKLIIQKLRSIN